MAIRPPENWRAGIAEEAHGGAGYCTEEHEQLCEYIDQTLSDHGIGVAALAARRDVNRAEITDTWRDW